MRENPNQKMSRGFTLFLKGIGGLHPSLLAMGGILWGASEIYFPILSPGIGGKISWFLGTIATILCFGSLTLHFFSHRMALGILGKKPENGGSLGFFGDLAQERECLESPLKELLVSLAGPLTNGILALISYFFWDFQFGGGWSALALFLMFFNLLIGTVNLSPFFPFDGGRIIKALFPLIKGRTLTLGGRVASIISFSWGLILLLQGVQYGRECGLFTIFLSLIILWESFGDRAPSAFPKGVSLSRGWNLLILLLVPFMVLSFFSVFPIPWGIEAPGIAAEVEGMVKIPPEFLHPREGHFLLTSVISQTPILLSQFLYAVLDPSVDLVPPERVIPPEFSPKEWTEINLQDLQESQAYAIFLALNSAGFPAEIKGGGALVISFLDGSPARGILNEGDLIVEAEGKEVRTLEDLMEIIGSCRDKSTVKLKVMRDGEVLNLETSLIYPQGTNEKPRLGVQVATGGYSLKTPFPVTVFPQKILGGPSAGLMFALCIYNLITPEDLTGGRIIAGTGTLDKEGNVGPVGGIKEKVISAERAGGEFFFCPEENFKEATKFASRIKVIKVHSFSDAIALLKSLKLEN